jgi:Fur family ferric uptake transcriptional regulator
MSVPAHPSPASQAARLRAAGLRVTGPRLAVLAVLHDRPGHHAAAAVARWARERSGSVSTQAVYDVLAALGGAGLVRRIELPGGPARYEARVGDNHHHLVCRACGRVVDVDCPVGRAPCLEPGGNHGFAVDEADVTFWGVCPDCTATRSNA